MIIVIAFAFLAGIVTVLSPCVLPILPIILSGSVGEGKRKPYGIVTGFILSFTFFTLFLTTLVRATGLASETLRYLSIGLISLFGISLLLPATQLLLERLMSTFSRFTPQTQKDGFGGGFVIGLSLGLLWTPCVGPILASVISLALTGSVTGTAFFITLAYSLGTSIPMFAIMYGGRQLLQKVPWLLRNTGRIQQAFGVIMIATGVGLFFNVDRSFQTWLLQAFPQYGTGLTKIENNSSVQSQLGLLRSGDSTQSKSGKTAPDFTGGGQWLNSEPLSLQKELKGKVVLVDFWTYSCINCIRTLPYIEKWYETYKDKGFVVVGVHSPEFEFEKKTDNVSKAIKDFGLTYPVVQDNDFNIWKAYNNQYWPAHYLIDGNGAVRATHFGEGGYEETENQIRSLLGETPLSNTKPLEQPTAESAQTPETYLGYARAGSYSPQSKIDIDTTKTYSFAGQLEADGVALGGSWLVGGENIVSKSVGAQLFLNFQSPNVYLVLGKAPGVTTPTHVTVQIDGKPVTADQKTADMDDAGVITVTDARKYDIAHLAPGSGRHLLTLTFDQGVEAYAFTFGM